MFFFYVMAIATACISACVSIFLRLRMPQRKWPECILAVLIVLGVITIWCSIFFCRRLGWHGAGHAWDSCDSRSVCRVLDRDGVPFVEKANQEKVRHLPSQMMSNFLQGGRNFLSSGEIHITLQ